ncbi:MAG: hypothetical protein C5B52_13025 [Bacteroidetes bacterium]|nr:MAG: hypothetical protein C5B52_13025 [Bacteroidota bacterium]
MARIDVSFTNNPEEFRFFEGPKINYSDQPVSEDELWITPAEILFEKQIREQNIRCGEFENFKIFFQCDKGDFPFDIFGASFYLISRYEEYLPHEKDEYGRYSSRSSLAFKEEFLTTPLINIWVVHLQKILRRKFPTILFRPRKFNFIPTYDIDIAFSYLNKGFVRNAGGLVRSLFKGQLGAMKERLDVLSGKKEDPFNVYEWLYALHLKYNLRPYYFFLVAKDPQGYDKNIDPEREEMQELIRYHAMGYQVGIHPSWQSGDNEELLKEEIGLMEYLINKRITCSRQHYIRFELPQTYRLLVQNGIEKEFSMGYGDINGFRASIASPFFWYDLQKEERTSLRVYPFCFMDANSFFEQKLTPLQAFDEIRSYHEAIKKVNGTMITIWHNTFFGSDKQYEGWKEVYELFLQEVLYWDF